MADDASFEAATLVIQSLATTQSQFVPVKHINGDAKLIPNSKSAAKAEFERELTALVARVRLLESKACDLGLPDTAPRDRAKSIPFEDTLPTRSKNLARDQIVTSLLAAKAHANGQAAPQFIKISDAELEALREHVADQSSLLSTQKRELEAVKSKLLEQKNLQEQALRAVEVERVVALERELAKHRQANEAFQKALREIGGIVTAVARGDLSKKVQIHSMEMDPEITTFKRTINTMMDQLQMFSSEVSRVAREVGTEGILGGQAQITGVDGTWKELTNNGKPFI